MKPKVLARPPVQIVHVPVTDTAGSSTVIANRVKDSDVPYVKGGIPKGDSENLTKEDDVEAWSKPILNQGGVLKVDPKLAFHIYNSVESWSKFISLYLECYN